MTQEELDALMNGDIDDIEGVDDEETSTVEVESDTTHTDAEDGLPTGYEGENSSKWPLPATQENKMVRQLDSVTQESEEKATEIFDIIEQISNDLMDKEESANQVIDVAKGNIELFTTLSEKFPDVDTFKTQLEKNQDMLAKAEESLEAMQNGGDSLMQVMDIMQYQDIHRQKIERVINVMRSLSRYMSSLFESERDDTKRVSSAQHIVGDTHNELASTDDIEALLAQFGH